LHGDPPSVFLFDTRARFAALTLEQAVHAKLAEVEDRHWWWRARREIIAAAVARYAPTPPPGGLRLAEVGCGSGGNLGMLSRFGTVLGAEPEASAVEYLHSKRGDAFKVLCHRIPEPLPDRYHVLGMFDVLEHIADDAGTMSWAAEHLAPGGVLILTVPAFQFLWTEQDEAAHHLRRYTTDDLVRLVPPSLALEHVSYFNSLLFPPILAVRTAMRLVRRRDHPPRDHLGIPPEPINWLFYRILRLERHFVPRRRWRFGVSILLVARRRS
jgi:SAM-dependent methyltransferase